MVDFSEDLERKPVLANELSWLHHEPNSENWIFCVTLDAYAHVILTVYYIWTKHYYAHVPITTIAVIVLL